MKTPKHLSHQPIISVNDYDKIDAHYINNTDARALSIGFAQYDKNEISLKVWRNSGRRWSRQSEELPLHRNIDLTILLIGALMTNINSPSPKTSLKEEINATENVKQILDYYDNHKEFLSTRLEELRNRLNLFLDNN